MMIVLNSIDERKDYPFIGTAKRGLEHLAASIQRFGVIEMPLVRETEDGRMELIAGYKRKRACEMLGMKRIPCVVMKCSEDMMKSLMLELHLIDKQFCRK